MAERNNGLVWVWVAAAVLVLLFSMSMTGNGTWMGGWAMGWMMVVPLLLLGLAINFAYRYGRMAEKVDAKEKQETPRKP